MRSAGERAVGRTLRTTSAIRGLHSAWLPAAVIAIVACAVGSTAPMLGGPEASAATTATSSAATVTTSLPPVPGSVSATPYSGGRAFVSWTPGQGNESDFYHVETYMVTRNGLADEGGTSAAGDNTVIGSLTVGSSYEFAVSATNSSGSSPSTMTSALTAVGLLVPGAPSGVKLTSDGHDNQLTLTWAASVASPAAEQYQIGVFEGSGTGLHQVGAVTCDAPCESKVIQATPGSVTSVLVTAANPVGLSSSTWSNSVQVPQPCPLACVTVAAGNPGTSFGHPSDGFLVPAGPAGAGTLAPQQWRTNIVTLSSMTPLQIADVGNAAVTEVLSDDWHHSHSVGGYAVTPWSNWSTYSSWVAAAVPYIESLAAQKGVHISYWEIQNEPFGGYYYSDSAQPPASETVSTFESQFLMAYRAIKAADPSAQVMGPSLITFAADPADVAAGIDMRTFLDFCVANGIKLGAVSFHDNNLTGSSGWYEPDRAPVAQPAEVQGHVAELQQLIAQRPSLGHPAILVNEYGDPYTYELPGWDVGRVAALDAAGVAGANRSCWADCAASLDGLFTRDGQSTLPGYWVYSFYSGMEGRTVPVTSSYTDVTGLASVDGTGKIEALIGRHQSCTRLSSVWCPSYSAEQATVTVQVPNATSVQVTVAAIPMGSTLSSPLTSLDSTTSTEQVVNGSVRFSTPSLNDGDAVEVTVTPVA